MVKQLCYTIMLASSNVIIPSKKIVPWSNGKYFVFQNFEHLKDVVFVSELVELIQVFGSYNLRIIN